MRRDFPLIREMMLEVEAGRPISIRRRDDPARAHNAVLAIEGGLAIGRRSHAGWDALDRVEVADLTQAGHDFLDLARDEGRWQEAMRLTDGGRAPFEVLRDVLARELARGAAVPA